MRGGHQHACMNEMVEMEAGYHTHVRSAAGAEGITIWTSVLRSSLQKKMQF